MTVELLDQDGRPLAPPRFIKTRMSSTAKPYVSARAPANGQQPFGIGMNAALSGLVAAMGEGISDPPHLAGDFQQALD